MTPAEVRDLCINLTPDILWKAKLLEPVDEPDLVAASQHVAVASLHRYFVAVDQGFRVIEEMSIAEAHCDSKGRARSQALHHVREGVVGKSRGQTD